MFLQDNSNIQTLRSVFCFAAECGVGVGIWGRMVGCHLWIASQCMVVLFFWTPLDCQSSMVVFFFWTHQCIESVNGWMSLDCPSLLESSTQHAFVAVGADLSMVLWFSSDTSELHCSSFGQSTIALWRPQLGSKASCRGDLSKVL